jgi:hypothetical protein
MIVCANEAITKLHDTVNRYNSLHWFSENPNVYIEKAVNLPRLLACCDVSRSVVWGTTLL